MTSYYVHNNGLPQNQTRGLASIVRAELDAIASSWTLLPTAAQLGAGLSAYFVDSGSANAYVITAGSQVTAYADGQTFLVKATNANTTTSTINVSGLGLKSIVRNDGSVLQANDIVAGQIIQLSYNVTAGNFQLSGSAASASATAAAASATAAASSATSSASSATSSASSATSSASSATASASSATAAAASATQASVYAAALTATSTTSLLIATGSTTFTTQAGKQFAAGQFVSAASNANSANYMHGSVTSYSGTTLVVNVTDIGGSGTLADWNLSVSGSQGSTGPTGPGILTRVEVSGTTQAATNGNDYWLENVALTAVTAPAATNNFHFSVTPANGLFTNTIDFGAATVRGYAGTATGVITIDLGAPMEFIYSSTLSQWVLK